MSRETACQIEEAATKWVMRLDHHGRTQELLAELEAWLAGDARRRGALLQAEAAWALLDAARAPEERQPATTPRFNRRHAMFGGGAALAASLAGFAFLSPWERYATKIGEIRRVPLADGSIAAINTASTIGVRMKAKERIVVLSEGEAWFQVTKDRKRPFTVEAGRVRVQAVGTAFSVRRHVDGAEILVSEGVVQAWTAGAEGNLIRLAAGERAFIADNAAVVRPKATPSEVDRALAWRAGNIDLGGEPLVNAVDEFNRYNERKLIIADPAIGRERFFGIFRTDDPDGFARAIHESLGVTIAHGASGEIRIGG